MANFGYQKYKPQVVRMLDGMKDGLAKPPESNLSPTATANQ